MTLDELQAEFPHGSRWRQSEGEAIWKVVGWDLDVRHGRMVVCRGDRTGSAGWLHPYGNVRVPDPPPPCPITEPTTLTRTASLQTWTSSDVQHPSAVLTLHPAEPGATEGRYTWGDQ